MNFLTRQEAITAGLTRYFTGHACPSGHVAERLVSTRACAQCVREKKHAWSAANPEKVNAQKRSWRERNLEKARAQNLANQKKNRAAANARNRRWRAAHLEHANAATAAWAKRNPEKNAAKAARRRAAELRAMPKWADHEAIAMIYRAAEVIRTTGFDVHVDHVVPLQGKVAAGLHVHNNLRILQARANRSKSNQLTL